MRAVRCLRFLLGGYLVLLASPACADLRLLHSVANLGELRGGTVFSHRVEWVNDGKLPLEILEVKRACGCLAPVLTQKTLAPGEKGSFVMQVRTLGQPNGPRSWQATIRYRQGDAIRETALTIAGNVQNEVTLEPTILVLSVSGVLKQEVRLVDSRKQPLKVTEARVNAAAVRVQTSTAAGVTKIALEVHGKELASDRQDALLDLYTDDPHYRHFQVPITLLRAATTNIRPAPEVARISLGASGTGSTLVRLRSTSDQPLAIDRVEAGHAAVQCTTVAGPGNDVTLKIQVDGKRAGAAPLPDVVVHFREPSGQSVRVPVEVKRGEKLD